MPEGTNYTPYRGLRRAGGAVIDARRGGLTFPLVKQMRKNEKRRQAGKAIKIIEYGIKYPNGDVIWLDANHRFDLSTEEGRQACLQEFLQELESYRLNYKPELQFVQRHAVTRYSAGEPIKE